VNIFDTHAHYDDEAFNEDRFDLLNIMMENNVKYIINQGVDIKSSLDSISLAEKYSYIYAAVGIHPLDVKKMEDISKIEELAKHEKVVAIGEIGLDYYYDYDKPSQKELFIKQLEIADRLNLPFCIHCRDAASDVFEILSENKHLINHSGLMHCYSEGKEWFDKFLGLGLYLSFSGNITYKKSDRTFLKDIPLDRILIETDSPYLSPEPVRGRKNEPKNVRFVIEKIASEIGVSSEELKKITTENAKKFYNLR